MRSPEADWKKLKEGKWHEYLIRFVFGGLVTLGAGWVAKQYGPSVGGLFLAFPAIFPASVTLIQAHEQRKHGAEGESKGKQKAGMNSAGALAGSVGMLAFGLVVWQLAVELSPWLCLPLAFASWLAVSLVAWAAQQHLWPDVDREAPGGAGAKESAPAKAS